MGIAPAAALSSGALRRAAKNLLNKSTDGLCCRELDCPDLLPNNKGAAPMSGLIGAILILFVFTLIPYTMAVAMPNWRWLLGAVLIVAPPFAAGPSRRLMIGNIGPCGGFGFAVLIGAVGLSAGVVVRGLTLLLRSRGIAQRRIDMIRVAGTMIAPAMILAPEILTVSGLWSHAR
jgi:hypothetical protein